MSASLFLGVAPAIEAGTGAVAVGTGTAGLFGTGGAFTMAQTLSTLKTVGTGLSAIGSISSGVSGYQAEKLNAKLAVQQAEYEAAQKRKEAQRLISSQRAKYGASGVQVETGSPVEVMSGTAGEAEEDALAILYGGKAESTIRKSAATSKLTGGILGAGSSLLAGL